MRVSSFLKVVLAVFLGISALGVPAMLSADVAAQSGNGFVMDATRMCGESLALRWDASNVEKIEFSVTDTSLNWTTGWIEATDFESRYHFEPVGQRFDKVMVRVTFFDSSTAEYSVDIGACQNEISSPWPKLDTKTDGGGGGHSGPTPQDGSYDDPVSGNSFRYLSATRMCEDNSLVTSWAGSNISNIEFMIYSPSNGWGGTEWLDADANSGMFTASVERDTAYMVDAAVTFEDESVTIVSIDIPDCTEASETPDNQVGDNTLIVQFSLPNDENIEGAPYSFYAPQAAVQFLNQPFATGVVGANNTIQIDALMEGKYRLLVSPEGMDPIDIVINVGDQSVTNATVTVNADGSVSIAYAVQEEPTPAAPSETPTAQDGEAKAPSESASGTSPDPAASGVSGLPSTGAGTASGTDIGAAALMTAAALTLLMIPMGYALGIRRKR